MEKTPKSCLNARGMVIYTLVTNTGPALSLKEIQSRIFQDFQTSMAKETIVAALDQGDLIPPSKIIETSERRGPFRQPTKVFSLEPIKTEKDA